MAACTVAKVMGKGKFGPLGATNPLNQFRWNLEYIEKTCLDHISGPGEGRPRNPLLPEPRAAQARALSRQLV